MISTYLRIPPLSHILYVVEIQFAILMVLAVFVLILLVHRNRAAVRIEKLKTAYADALISEMLSLLESGEGMRAIVAPRFYEFRRREILKTVFLEHFNSVSGPEKVFLAKRYDELLFALDDYNATGSFVWWRRLQAVSNLSLVGSAESAPLLYRMTYDRNSLVSATAFLALSQLKSDLNKPRLVTELPAALLQRKNLLFEILRNWSLVHGASSVINQIRLVKDPTLLGVLVSAVSTLQSTEIGDAYAKILETQTNLPPPAIQDMLVLLRRVGDPAWIETVRPYASHAQEVIRLRALEYLIGMGEFDLLQDERVKTDPSHVVQRWLQAQNSAAISEAA